jgi:hypothetical protein
MLIVECASHACARQHPSPRTRGPLLRVGGCRTPYVDAPVLRFIPFFDPVFAWSNGLSDSQTALEKFLRSRLGTLRNLSGSM